MKVKCLVQGHRASWRSRTKASVLPKDAGKRAMARADMPRAVRQERDGHGLKSGEGVGRGRMRWYMWMGGQRQAEG